MSERGQYGSRGHGGHGHGAYPQHPHAMLAVGRELTEGEIRDAQEAGRRSADALIQARDKMLREWKPDAPLSATRMTQIMDESLRVARETVARLSEMIGRVPEDWEEDLRNKRDLINGTVAQESPFRNLVAQATSPTVAPGFRDWISDLFTRSADGVSAIGYAAHVLPNWLSMRSIASDIRDGLVGVARFVGGGFAAVPTALKVAGIGAAVVGGIWAVSKIRSSTSAKTSAKGRKS